ncbi:MAG TPA: polyprenyl synthetase family protein [Polyangia bacterium]|nr:polyprenyl synthetase family protein [Polyangia bacterium]
MSTRPQRRTAFDFTMDSLVDEALSPIRLLTVAHPEDWPEPQQAPALLPVMWDRAVGVVARDILDRPSRQFRARLCQLAWSLADGAGPIPAQLSAIVEIVHAGSLIVDDIEDDSLQRRGAPCLHVVHGLPRALNAGNWMYFWAMTLIDQAAPDPAVADQLRRAYGDALYHCHLGQALDLSTPVGRIPRAWMYRTVATSTMLKTGMLMELAARMGALAAQTSEGRVAALARFGRRLGLGLQMLDDFGNLTAPASQAAEAVDSKALEDLRNGRPTWRWALAAAEPDLDAATFEQMQASAVALASGEDRDGTRARALAATLRMAVGLKGRQQAARYLHAALADLRASVGDRTELTLLSAEIQRLEASYG